MVTKLLPSPQTPLFLSIMTTHDITCLSVLFTTHNLLVYVSTSHEDYSRHRIVIRLRAYAGPYKPPMFLRPNIPIRYRHFKANHLPPFSWHYPAKNPTHPSSMPYRSALLILHILIANSLEQWTLPRVSNPSFILISLTLFSCEVSTHSCTFWPFSLSLVSSTPCRCVRICVNAW